MRIELQDDSKVLTIKECFKLINGSFVKVESIVNNDKDVP